MIKVGGIFEMSLIAIFGTTAYNGSKLYIDELNKSGELGKK